LALGGKERVMNLVTIRTEELEGRALHWAVAKAVCPPLFSQSVNPHSGLSFWSEGYLGGLTKDPTSVASELMVTLSIGVTPWRKFNDEEKCEAGREWCAHAPQRKQTEGSLTYVTTFDAYAENPVTAIFRTVVLLLLDQEVQVPDDLLEVKNG